jgi:hypothetical protein
LTPHFSCSQILVNELEYSIKKQFHIKGGDDEENHYIGNGFSDDACINWRLLAMVVGRW